MRGLIEKGRVDTAHDLSDGGLLVAIAEMAMADGIGASIGQAGLADAIAFFFGEDQARYVIAAPFAEAEKIVAEARAAYLPWPNWARPAATPSSSTTRTGEPRTTARRL